MKTKINSMKAFFAVFFLALGTLFFNAQNGDTKDNVFYYSEQQTENTQTGSDPGGGNLGGDDNLAPIDTYIPLMIFLAMVLLVMFKNNNEKKESQKFNTQKNQHDHFLINSH